MTETPKRNRIQFPAEAFKMWERRRGFDWRQSSESLGCDIKSIYKWRKEGAPYYIGLACAAIDHNLDIPDTRSGPVSPASELYDGLNNEPPE